MSGAEFQGPSENHSLLKVCSHDIRGEKNDAMGVFFPLNLTCIWVQDPQSLHQESESLSFGKCFFAELATLLTQSK